MTPDRWLQIKEILNAALERPKSERFAYVETVCGADTTLRDEVARLLAQETAESLASPAAELFQPTDALTSGEMFAQYRVEKKVGEGGMGAVYLARDTKLGRNIALKVLPEALATDANLARLRREAKVLASLNHPHIATIYGLEQNALVMEFIEGPTLAERIDRGPIPLPEALAIARQMAEALDYAHEKGVIHRDLKPANIKIALGGGVKVLDFGLAKMVDPDGQPVADSVLSVERLGAGAILGTPAYMAPEQASGGTVDWRADVWAFGVVLFEMLTGQTLFGRGAVSDTLSAVLSHVPDWALLPKDTPHWVRNLLRRCLERDKSKRLRHLGDAWQTGDSGEPPAAPSRLPWIAAAGIALVAILASWSPCRTPQALSLRFDIDAGGVPNSIAVSPNGMRVVFRAGDIRAATPLLTRRLDDDRTIPLAGTEGGRDPFFSPDGRWLAFFADGKLRKISIDGGLPVTICDALNGRGGAWGEDGSIVVALDVTGGLSRVDSNGGQAQLITGLHGEVDSGEAHRWPQMLPQGKGVLYTALSGQQTSLWILPRGSTRPKMLLANARDARVLPGGHLVYFKQGSLQAAPIDIDRLAVTGPGVPLLPNVAPFLNARASYDLARSGTLVYVRGGQEPNRVVSWLDASGKLEPLLAESGRYLTPRLSPDGKRLAVAIEKGDGANVWVYDIVRDTMIPMPVGGEYQFYPVWSPHGQHLVFQSDGQLAWTRADGSGPIHYLPGTRQAFPGSFSADGLRLYFHQATRGNYDLWDVTVDTAQGRFGKPRRLTDDPVLEQNPAVSPDGKWLAYAAPIELTRPAVYVVPLLADGRIGAGKWQISSSPGWEPVWAKGGREIFYRRMGGGFMVVSYSVRGDVFIPEKPRVWSEQRTSFGNTHVIYDLAPGSRMAVLLDVEPETPKPETHLRVVTNILTGLKVKE